MDVIVPPATEKRSVGRENLVRDRRTRWKDSEEWNLLDQRIVRHDCVIKL